MREAPFTDFKIIDALIFLTDVNYCTCIYKYMYIVNITKYSVFVASFFCDLIQNSRIGELIAGMYSILYPIYIYIHIYISHIIFIPEEGHFKDVLYLNIYVH